MNENVIDQWYGFIPWIRMYHCLLENSMLQSFLDMYKQESREGIDSRNVSTRKKNCFENYTNLQDNPSYKSKSIMYLDLYDDFIVSHNLFESDEVKLLIATPDKIKDKIAEACSKLSLSQILYHTFN